jgi:superfamily I DNA/RNA helicase
VDELRAALQKAGIVCQRLSDGEGSRTGVQLGTMHRAKGLEFKAVLVFGCGARTIPSQAALAGIADPLDRDAAEARERQLLYVAMTRARDELRVTWNGAPSPFLASVQGEQR